MRLFHATTDENLEGILKAGKLMPRLMLDLSEHVGDLDQAERYVQQYWNKTLKDEQVRGQITHLLKKDFRSASLWMGDFDCARMFSSSNGIILGFEAPEHYQTEARKQGLAGLYNFRDPLPLQHLVEYEPVEASSGKKRQYHNLLKDWT